MVHRTADGTVRCVNRNGIIYIERRQVAHEGSSERHWKFCTAQIAPSTSAKPQATLVYAVLLMLM